MALALLTVAGLSAQTGSTKQVRSSDPAVSRILVALSQPSRATAEVQEIKIPAGDYTHCVTTTSGNRSDSDCSPRTRFEQMHKLILRFTVDGRPVEVVGGCSSYEHDRRCGMIALGGMAPPECRDVTNPAGVATHNVCSEKGTGIFVVEKKKNRFYIYPVEGKPNRRYYIPLATIDGTAIIPD